MDSLYGGHQGISFVLKAAFPSISDMVKAFKGGPNYTDVWYGEFCIIDTPNKNDKDNGKIYERGYNYQNDMGGAVYKGQIVGPSSGTPYFAMDSIKNVTDISTKDISNNPYTYRRFPTGKDENGNYVTAANGDIATFDFGKPDVLVPGKDENGKFNDKIKYTWCNIREDNADSDSWFYVGWQIPYLVVDYDIHTNSPYNNKGEASDNASTIERKDNGINTLDNGKHPFYERWDIGLPHGIKGDAIRNLRVITPPLGNPPEKIYPYDALKIDDKGIAAIDTTSDNYDGYNDDVAKGHQIIVFDYYAFDKQINPNPYHIYIGDFNIVKSVTVSENGTLTVSYTSKEADVTDKLVKWVKSISLNTDVGVKGGQLKVTYNNDSEPFTVNLVWLKDITIAENGDVTYTYVGQDSVTEKAKMKWLKDIDLKTDTGKLTITLNNTNEHDENIIQKYLLRWVQDIRIAENGTITLVYTGETNQAGEYPSKDLTTKLKNITSATVSNDGIITFTCNTGDTIKLKTKTANQQTVDFHLPWITGVSLDSNSLTADKRIAISYNNQNGPTAIGSPINFVQNMIVRPSDWHLLVLFNDPTHRYRPKTNELSGTWVNGPSLKSWNADVSNAETEDGIYWRDYGPIKDQAGVLVGFNLTYKYLTENSSYKTPLEWLNNNLPNGLTGEQNTLGGSSTMGKIVAYTPQKIEGNPDPGCEFYAFDYRDRVTYPDGTTEGWQWFYLGTIADNGLRDVGLAEPGTVVTQSFPVNTKGLIFKQNVITVADALDEFWAIDYAK